MPMRVEQVGTAGEVYANPFVGPVDHTYAIRVTPSDFTNAEIDQYGYLKPGLPLTRAAELVGAAGVVHGCVVEATKIAKSNSAGDIAAAAAVDVSIAVIGAVNRALLEDNLGRALTADELAGFDAAGSKIALLY